MIIDLPHFFLLAVELVPLFRKTGNILVQLVLCVLNRHRENIGSKFAVAQQSGSDFLRQLFQLAFQQAVFFFKLFYLLLDLRNDRLVLLLDSRDAT